SSSKNIPGRSPSGTAAWAISVRVRASARRRGGESRARAASSRFCTGSGARRKTARPGAVSASSMRRASVMACRRATSPRSTSRRTTTDTELWSVCVRAASAPRESAGAAASSWSTKSCAPLIPAVFSAARAESRRARTSRRSASITARTSSACSPPPRWRRSIGTHTMTTRAAMPNAGEDFCYDRLVPTPVLVRRLAAALAELAPERALRLTAAHVDHGLRGAESAADRERAARLARALGVPFCWRPAAVAPGPGVEARARRARYAALEALAREAGAARIVTGHTRDDQVETVLLRLLRGAGRGGLAGMRACRGRLWRPLLAVTRADVRRFLAERGLDFAVDRS